MQMAVGTLRSTAENPRPAGGFLSEFFSHPEFLAVLVCHPTLFIFSHFDAQYRMKVQICLLEQVKARGLWHLPGGKR